MLVCEKVTPKYGDAVGAEKSPAPLTVVDENRGVEPAVNFDALSVGGEEQRERGVTSNGRLIACVWWEDAKVGTSVNKDA